MILIQYTDGISPDDFKIEVDLTQVGFSTEEYSGKKFVVMIRDGNYQVEDRETNSIILGRFPISASIFLDKRTDT